MQDAVRRIGLLGYLCNFDHNQKHLGAGWGVYFIYIIQGYQGKNSKLGPEGRKQKSRRMLLHGLFPWFARCASYMLLDHLPKDGTAHNILDLPTSIINQGNPLHTHTHTHTHLQTYLMETFFFSQLRLFIPSCL